MLTKVHRKNQTLKIKRKLLIYNKLIIRIFNNRKKDLSPCLIQISSQLKIV